MTQEAIEKAGLDYEEATGVRRWSPAKVVVAVRQLARCGGPLSASYERQPLDELRLAGALSLSV